MHQFIRRARRSSDAVLEQRLAPLPFEVAREVSLIGRRHCFVRPRKRWE